MPTKKLFSFIILAASIINCFAQKQDRNWVFGDSIGIDFNNLSTPTVYTTTLNYSDENYSCISDSSGNLLFYLGGADTDIFQNKLFTSKLYDKSFQVMQSGDSIATDYSEEMGSIIIPFVGASNKFYLFHLQTDPVFGGATTNFFYSVIDLNYNNGLGKVVTKNIVLLDTLLTEKLTAVRHANGKDWWVIVHGGGSRTFYKFLITQYGIANATEQKIGSNLGSVYICDLAGQMEFSSDGRKLVNVNPHGIIDLFDFDRCTGELSNWKLLDNLTNCNNYDHWGCSFSRAGTVLYVSDLDNLFQYDLLASDIPGSELLIWNDTSAFSEITTHQLGPDGKIYIGSHDGPNEPTAYFLSVINSPDSLGMQCNLTPYSFYLGGHRIVTGLPNEPNYNLGPLPIYMAGGAGNDTTINEGDTVQIGTNAISGLVYQWSPSTGLNDASSPQPNATPDSTITYYLTITDTSATYSCNIKMDTITITVITDTITPPPIDTTVCAKIVTTLLAIQQPFTIQDQVQGTSVTMYDLLGRKIFKSSDYKNNWSAPVAGMYLYVLTCPSGMEWKGKVVVIQ